MGDWDSKAACSGDVLERIVALLFALADLADRAAGIPVLRRRHVLGILSHGEAEARAFLFGGAPVPADAPASAGDAERLATRLRALALVLCILMTRAWQFAPPGAFDWRDGRPSPAISGLPVRRPAVPPPPAPDTS